MCCDKIRKRIGSTRAEVSFLIKLQTGGLQLYQKETPAQVFSYEFCKISKYVSFTEHLGTTSFEHYQFCFIPYRTKKCRTKFSSDKMFLRTKFSSPMKNFVTLVRRKFCPMLKFLIHVFSVTFFIRRAKTKEKKHLHKFFKVSILTK